MSTTSSSTSAAFPAGFLWGTATAAHQVEGGNANNDSWLLEHMPRTIYADVSGDACDHYHRYADDIALLAKLGFNTYRFSLEWSRIEPEEGEFSRAALEHYRRMLACCHEHGLTPIVTFHHFTSPRWLLASGGWEDARTPEKFARFCERAARHLGDLIGYACTINEANITQLFFKLGLMPPLQEMHQSLWWLGAARALSIAPDRLAPFTFSLSPASVDVVIAAHRRAVDAIKSGPRSIPTGITLAVMDVQAAEGGETLAAQMNREINDIYLEAIRGDDFVGVQCYSRARFGANGPLPPEAGVEVTQMGYEFWPEALEACLRHTAAVAGIPMIVTENGIGTHDDTRRIEYVRRALRGVANCLKDGLDVRGYTYWSAFDNFEWMLGYRPTFGLIEVDRETQTRTAKPSAYWLGEIARTNGVSLD